MSTTGGRRSRTMTCRCRGRAGRRQNVPRHDGGDSPTHLRSVGNNNWRHGRLREWCQCGTRVHRVPLGAARHHHGTAWCHRLAPMANWTMSMVARLNDGVSRCHRAPAGRRCRKPSILAAIFDRVRVLVDVIVNVIFDVSCVHFGAVVVVVTTLGIAVIPECGRGRRRIRVHPRDLHNRRSANERSPRHTRKAPIVLRTERRPPRGRHRHCACHGRGPRRHVRRALPPRQVRKRVENGRGRLRHMPITQTTRSRRHHARS